MSQNKIIIDIGSGDHAPDAIFQAACQFSKFSKGFEIVLVGHLSNDQIAKKPRHFHYEFASDVIHMVDSPSTALRKGSSTSMGKVLKMLADSTGNAVAISAGNTAALIAMTKHMVGMHNDCLKRPALMSKMPGCAFYCSDLGANLTLSAEQMLEMARFCAQMLSIERPKVALVNIGKEAEKGPTSLKEAYALMQNCSEFDFQGFIEPHEVFQQTIDLLITDGMIGNIMLKSFEGAFTYTAKGLIRSLAKTLFGKLALWNHSPLQQFIQMHQHHQVAILAGAKKPVLKVHGRADVSSFLQSLFFAKQFMLEERRCSLAESVQ